MTLPPVRMADPEARARAVGAAGESAVLNALRSGRWIGGPLVAEAERAAAAGLERAHGVGVGSGTDALMIALQVAGVRPGQEVIVPAFTFFATAGAVAAIGAVPVFADVREDGNLDPESAGDCRSERTAAVVPVHLFGQPAALPDLGVPVVDDAAQAFGATPAPPGGRLTTVSVYPTKLWGAAGDGGFILSNDPELIADARALARHGLRPGAEAHHRVGAHIGRNSGLDAIQAAWLLAQLPALPAWRARRREIAARYDAELPPRLRPLPRAPSSPVSQYVVRTPDRDALRAKLAAAGVESRVYYPRPLCDEPAFADRAARVPVARALCAEVLALPCHEGLSDDEVERVLRAVGR